MSVNVIDSKHNPETLTVMASMPRAPNSVALLPSLLGVWNSSNFTDDFVTWDHWQWVAKALHADNGIGMANTTC